MFLEMMNVKTFFPNRAIINHFSPKVDSWAAANQLSSLTEEQVMFEDIWHLYASRHQHEEHYLLDGGTLTITLPHFTSVLALFARWGHTNNNTATFYISF